MLCADSSGSIAVTPPPLYSETAIEIECFSKFYHLITKVLNNCWRTTYSQVFFFIFMWPTSKKREFIGCNDFENAVLSCWERIEKFWFWTDSNKKSKNMGENRNFTFDESVKGDSFHKNPIVIVRIWRLFQPNRWPLDSVNQVLFFLLKKFRKNHSHLNPAAILPMGAFAVPREVWHAPWVGGIRRFLKWVQGLLVLGIHWLDAHLLSRCTWQIPRPPCDKLNPNDLDPVWPASSVRAQSVSTHFLLD